MRDNNYFSFFDDDMVLLFSLIWDISAFLINFTNILEKLISKKNHSNNNINEPLLIKFLTGPRRVRLFYFFLSTSNRILDSTFFCGLFEKRCRIYHNLNIRVFTTIRLGKNDADLPKLRKKWIFFTCISNL